MSQRLTRIYTRSGDTGLTGLADGSRVPKDDVRIIALGEVDELNSVLGVLLAEAQLPDEVRARLTHVQHLLFDLGAALSVAGRDANLDSETLALERAMDDANEVLGPLREFILPGGCRAAALCHLARTVCRRAERALVALDRDGLPSVLRFMNRLSDYLFVMARWSNHASGVPDVLWQSAERREAGG